MTDLTLLAERCEREEPSRELDAAIENALAGGSAADLAYILTSVETTMRPPKYTTSLDAVVTLEPRDAQEVCVRRYPGGGMYVRISLASGRPVYSEALDRPIGEAMARCAAALRALAAKTVA